MWTWIAWLIAAFSSTTAVILWLREVRRVLLDKRAIVSVAAAQLTSARQTAANTPEDTQSAAVLTRSTRIYRQAVSNYNTALVKPAYCLPAFLLGFSPIELP